MKDERLRARVDSLEKSIDDLRVSKESAPARYLERDCPHCGHVTLFKELPHRIGFHLYCFTCGNYYTQVTKQTLELYEEKSSKTIILDTG